MIRARSILMLAALTLPLGACVVGPKYQRPDTPKAAAGRLAEAGSAAIADTPVAGSWWHLYHDPVLDRLVAEALTHNTDIREAAANLQRARAALSEQKGARLPSTDLSGQYQRQQSNSSSAAAFGGTGGAIRTFRFDLFQSGFDVSYELDLFGGVTRAIQAARGDYEASRAQLDAARVSVAAETARAYVTACSNAAQLSVARDTAGLQSKTFSLTKALSDAGRGTQRDVERADVLLAQTEAQIPGFEAERKAALFALATLTGRPPEVIDADAAQCTTPPRLNDPLPSGDGAALIARRPDVRAAERSLAAETARIGVAIAELYPKISLLGSVGQNATQFSKLGEPTSVRYSFGPLISWNLPNQTVARARVREAKATTAASLARFDGAVLNALKETEQALARYAGALDSNAALARAERASGEAARLSRLRFEAGADSFLQLIQAERDRADARAARAQSDAAVADAQISLFKALGGGWEDAPNPVRRTDDNDDRVTAAKP